MAGRDSRAATGRQAEDLAARRLQELGYRIVARNWRRPEGEIDIVADDNGTCVFVEVRSRSGDDRGHPLETITAGKRAQVIRAARLFMNEELSALNAAKGFRFDVVGVTFNPGGGTPEYIHIENAFEVA